MGTNAAPDTVAVPAGRVTLSDRRSRRSWQVDVAAFHMAVLPVTQEQHSAVTGEHPGAARGARLPVERVSWWDAVRFSNALSEQAARMPAYRVRGEEIDRDPAARIDDGVPGRLPVS